MHVDNSGLEKQVRGISNAISDVKSAFHSDWDDVVHESFKKFIKDLIEKEESLKKSTRKVGEHCRKISSLKDHNHYDGELKSLSREVAAIII